MIKVAISSYHTFYVDDAEDADEAIDRAVALLRSAVDNGDDEYIRLADCETKLDYVWKDA
jgi:hypothetical protein